MIKVTSNLKILAILTIYFTFLASIGEAQKLESTPYLRTEHAIKPLYFSFINPSKPNATARITSAIGYLSGTSEARKRIRSFYANTLVRIAHKDSLSQTHFLGIGISSEQDGPILARNEFTLKYELRQPINSFSFLKAGVDFGTLNYDIGSQGSNGGISIFIPTGHIGASYVYKNRSEIGIAINQMFNSTFDIGTDQPTRLIRHYNIHGSHQLKLNQLHDVNLFVWDKYVPETENRFGGYATYLYLSKFTLSIGLDSDFKAITNPQSTSNTRGVFTLGVTNWQLDQNNLIDAFIAYSAPINNTSISFANIEFGINYRML